MLLFHKVFDLLNVLLLVVLLNFHLSDFRLELPILQFRLLDSSLHFSRLTIL